jgi:epoxide hydrolase
MGENSEIRPFRIQIPQLPQYLTSIDGQAIHFLRIRSPQPTALPLLVTHGWPSSPVEFRTFFRPLRTKEGS